MNLKKAKRIRKILRDSEINPKETEYTLDARTQDKANRGTLSPFEVTIALVEDCGRKLYKQMKRMVR